MSTTYETHPNLRATKRHNFDLTQILDQYFDARDINKRLTSVNDLEYIGSCSTTELAGEMCAELALCSDVSSDDRVNLLGRATNNWKKSAILGTTGESTFSADAALSLMSLACSPYLYWRVLMGEFPPRNYAEKTFNQLIDIAQKFSPSIDATVFDSPDKYERDKRLGLFGALAEMNVLLLLQRFSIKNGLTDEWIAVPSLFSQNRGGDETNGIVNRWDISILNRFGGTPAIIEEAYKIQVKATAKENYSETTEYDNSITMIFAGSDLCISNKGIRPQQISREFAQERNGDTAASERLDRRADKLLDKLG